MSPKWPILCQVGRKTLLHTLGLGIVASALTLMALLTSLIKYLLNHALIRVDPQSYVSCCWDILPPVSFRTLTLVFVPHRFSTCDVNVNTLLSNVNIFIKYLLHEGCDKVYINIIRIAILQIILIFFNLHLTLLQGFVPIKLQLLQIFSNYIM